MIRTFQFIAACLVVGVCGVSAQTVTNWTGSGSGSNWNTAGNWSNGAPNTSNGIAQFNANTAKTPNISSNASLGKIVFTSGSDAESFAGTSTLTLNGVSGLGIDNQSSLTQTFANKFTVGGDQTWQTAAAGSGLEFDAAVNLSGHNLTVALAASGTSTVTFASTLKGTDSNLTIGGAGSVIFTSGATYTGTTTVNNGATLQLSGAAQLSNSTAVTVNPGGTFDANGVSNTVASIAGAGNVTLGGATLTLKGAADSTFSGVVSGSGGLTKVTGTGTLTLASANTYDGTTNINAGIIRIQNASALGSSVGGTVVTSGEVLEIDGTTGNFTVTGEVLTLTGTGAAVGGALRNIAGNNTWTGDLTLSGSTRINSDADTLTLSGGISGAQNLALGGTGDLEISGAIDTASHSVTKDGAGTLTLSGANLFTGKTIVSEGILSVSSLNSVVGGSASSNLGAPITSGNGTISLGSTTSSATLTYTGAGETTDRIVSLVGTTGGATIEANGTGALVFTSNLTNSGAGSKTLILAGTSPGNLLNTLSGVIPNNSSTRLTSIEKDGGNSWALTGNNTYTGTTTVTAGVLSISHIANAGSASSIGAANNGASDLVIDGGTLEYTGATASSNRLFTLGGNGGSLVSSASGGSLTLNNPGAIAFSGAGARTLTLAGDSDGSLAAVIGDASDATTVTKSGAGAWTLSGTNSYSGTTTVSDGALIVGNSAALGSSTVGTTVSIGASLQLATGGLTIAEPLILSGAGASDSGALRNTASSGTNVASGTIFLAADTRIGADAGGTLQLSGAISSSGKNLTIDATGNILVSGAIGTGSGGLTKEGAGDLTLAASGGNSFTGATAINAGQIITAAANQFNNAAALMIANGATLSLNDQAQIIGNLNGAGTLSLGLAGTGQLLLSAGAGTFAGSFAGSGTIIIGAGASLTLGADFNAPNVNFTLAGGTLSLNGTTSTFGNLNITGTSILDFGLSTNSVLTVNNITFLNGSVQLDVQNWSSLSDYFYTQNFTGVTPNSVGTAPENQISFAHFSNNDTTWQSWDHQVTPAPEPATYGLLMMATALGLFCWRRNRASV